MLINVGRSNKSYKTKDSSYVTNPCISSTITKFSVFFIFILGKDSNHVYKKEKDISMGWPYYDIYTFGPLPEDLYMHPSQIYASKFQFDHCWRTYFFFLFLLEK